MVLRSGLWWSVHLANKQSAHYMEHSIMERSIIHLKPRYYFMQNYHFFDKPLRKMSVISTPGSSLSFLLPKKCLLFRESLSQTGGQSDFLPWRCFFNVCTSALCLFALF